MRRVYPDKGDKTWGIGDALEVDVVDPRYIVAVASLSFRKKAQSLPPAVFNGLDLAIEAHGIFGQICLDGTASDFQRPCAPAGT